MLRYAIRRLIQAVPVIILIMIGTFLLLKLAPGDTVDALVGDMGGADAQFIARLRAENIMLVNDVAAGRGELQLAILNRLLQQTRAGES